MKKSVVASILILIGVTTVYSQKPSGRQNYELIGSVKVLRSVSNSYLFADGKYQEQQTPTNEPMVVVFDLEGTELFKAAGCKELILPHDYQDRGKSSYDQNGNITEYLSGDTLEHSHYKTRYMYDAKGRKVRSQEYDPYKLTSEAAYTYQLFDDRGNWTMRTITPETPINGRSWKTVEWRIIEYYR